MSKKTFTLIAILLLIIACVLGWYFFFKTPSKITPIDTDGGVDLFPFDNGTTTRGQGTSTDDGTDSTIDLSGNSVLPPRLRQLWKEPTAGAGFVTMGTSSAKEARFVDRATGHIYEAPLLALGNSKLSNITIPQIYEALVTPNANKFIFRYLTNDTIIKSFYVELATSTTNSNTPIEGYFLPQNIRDIYMLGTKIMYFDPTTETGNLLQASVDGTNRVSVLNSDLKEWLVSWNNSNLAFLVNRPSGIVGGHGYILDIAKGTFIKIMNNFQGLTGNISPSGEYVFFSGAELKGFASATFNLNTKAASVLSIKTLSDKCAWSPTNKTIIYCAVPIIIPQGTYPDDWYQGVISFTDRMWKIDVSTGETEVLFDPSFDATQDMDMIKLSVDPNDSHIMFTNKKDMSLWLYRLDNTISPL